MQCFLVIIVHVVYVDHKRVNKFLFIKLYFLVSLRIESITVAINAYIYVYQIEPILINKHESRSKEKVFFFSMFDKTIHVLRFIDFDTRLLQAKLL